MKRSVTIDARWLLGGIGTYTRQLLAGLARLRNSFDVAAITRQQHAESVANWCENIKIVDVPIYTIHEQLAVPWAAKDCDLLRCGRHHSPARRRIRCELVREHKNCRCPHLYHSRTAGGSLGCERLRSAACATLQCSALSSRPADRFDSRPDPRY